MNRFKLLGSIALVLSPFAYLGWMYPSLPATVPTHFDLQGVPNDYSSRGTLWLIAALLAGISIGCYFLFNNLHRIDPKRRGGQLPGGFRRLADGLLLFLTALNFMVLLACTGHEVSASKLMFPFMGLLFAFVGNIMFSIRPNYFAGIRVPWTLADNDNWRATHRLAGRLWFWGGLVLVAGSLLLRPDYGEALLFSLLAPMIIIPVAYSYWYFKHRPSGKA